MAAYASWQLVSPGLQSKISTVFATTEIFSTAPESGHTLTSAASKLLPGCPGVLPSTALMPGRVEPDISGTKSGATTYSIAIQGSFVGITTACCSLRPPPAGGDGGGGTDSNVALPGNSAWTALVVLTGITTRTLTETTTSVLVAGFVSVGLCAAPDTSVSFCCTAAVMALAQAVSVLPTPLVEHCNEVTAASLRTISWAAGGGGWSENFPTNLLLGVLDSWQPQDSILVVTVLCIRTTG